MNVLHVNVDGQKHPVKWNPRAKSKWESSTGLIWVSLFGTLKDNSNPELGYRIEPTIPTVEQSMILCLEALREGYRIENKPFKITLDNVYDWADEFELEDQIVNIIFPKSDAKKK